MLETAVNSTSEGLTLWSSYSVGDLDDKQVNKHINKVISNHEFFSEKEKP